MRKTLAALTLALLAFPALADDGDSMAGEFNATATVTTSQGTRSLAFTVVVDDPMRLADALPLKRVLEEGGQQALASAIRGGNRGRIRLGGLEYPIDLVVAEPIEDGYYYVVVTTRSLRFEGMDEERPSADFPFAVLVFDVPEFGSGEGNILPKASLSIDPDGRVRAIPNEGEPGTLADVRRADNSR